MTNTQDGLKRIELPMAAIGEGEHPDGTQFEYCFTIGPTYIYSLRGRTMKFYGEPLDAEDLAQITGEVA